MLTADTSFSQYLSTFSPSTTDDAERDEVLTQKIRIFRWIKPEHLDIPDNAHNAVYLDKAQAGMFLSVFSVPFRYLYQCEPSRKKC